MERFHIIEDGAAIIRSKGVFRQAKVYHRGKDVYAAIGAGFVKLGPQAGTSHPGVSWLDVEGEGVVCDRVGKQPRFAGADA